MWFGGTKIPAKDAETVLKRLGQTGTVAGPILARIFKAINLIESFYKGEIGD